MSHLDAKDAELSVLGGIVLDNTALDRVLPMLSAEDFHAPRNAGIYRAMAKLAERGDPVDIITLVTHFEKDDSIGAVGGLDYLLGLTGATATAVNIEHHAGIVRDAAEVRRLTIACAGIVAKARSGDYSSTAALVDEAQQAVFDIGSVRSAKAMDSLKAALVPAIGRIQAAYDSKSTVTGIPTGFDDLDQKTAGLHPGDLVILAARPAMGKTALALNIARNAAGDGAHTVAVFSLEMPTTQLAARILSSEARVNGEMMKTGHITEGDIDRLLQGVKRLNGVSVHIDDTAGASVMEVRSKCRRLAARKDIPPLGLIVIDYLQLMKGPPGVNGREQEISAISRGLKALAKELGVPVIALSQLNRGVESRPNKRPMLSDLRESGAIEQDADIIMFVYRDEYYNEASEDKGVAELIVGKHRSGSTGTVRLRFFRQWTRFDNLAREA